MLYDYYNTHPNATAPGTPMQLSRESGSPLYRQIAERLEYEIVTGRLRAEARLPSLRDAADAWGVNLHTVRKAYHELEASGFAEIGPRGATVARLARCARSGGIEAAVREFAARMRDEYGAGPSELRRALGRLETSAPRAGDRVSLIECSRTLSHDLADQVSERTGIAVEPIDLHDDRSLPEGAVIGTYFHAEHLKDRLGERAADLHLVRIRPRESLLAGLAARAREGSLRRLVLIDRLRDSAGDLAADFQSRLGERVPVEARILSDPLLAFPAAAPGIVVVASPQTWDRLTDELRARQDVVKLEYELEPEDLEQLARRLGVRTEDARD